MNESLLIVALLATLFAAFVHGTLGLGFAMIVTPTLALVTDMQTAILLTLIPTVLVNFLSIAGEGSVLPAIRRHALLGVLTMIGSGIGTIILMAGPSELFKLLLAGMLILYLYAGKIRLNITVIHRHPRASLVTFGIAAGVMGGLTNGMAPILVIYALEAGYPKREFIQASNLCFLLGKATQFILFLTAGMTSAARLTVSGFMCVAVIIAILPGLWIKRRIAEERYRDWLRYLLFGLALLLVGEVMFR